MLKQVWPAPVGAYIKRHSSGYRYPDKFKKPGDQEWLPAHYVYALDTVFIQDIQKYQGIVKIKVSGSACFRVKAEGTALIASRGRIKLYIFRERIIHCIRAPGFLPLQKTLSAQKDAPESLLLRLLQDSSGSCVPVRL